MPWPDNYSSMRIVDICRLPTTCRRAVGLAFTSGRSGMTRRRSWRSRDARTVRAAGCSSGRSPTTRLSRNSRIDARLFFRLVGRDVAGRADAQVIRVVTYETIVDVQSHVGRRAAIAGRLERSVVAEDDVRSIGAVDVDESRRGQDVQAAQAAPGVVGRFGGTVVAADRDPSRGAGQCGIGRPLHR